MNDYLCIGHICQDVKSDGYTLGGSASYCSIAAQLLGTESSVLTSFSKQFPFLSAFQNISLHNKESAATTIFENIYDGLDRTQFLLQRASNIYAKDIPKKWLNVPLVHLAPIADEVDFSIIKAFPSNTIIAATPQGWLRQWDKKSKKVSPKSFDFTKLNGIDILILSDEDLIGIESILSEIIKQIELVVLTRGEKAASVFVKGKQTDYPVYDVEIVDPTGAGDTFATGFLLKYLATKDISKAMAYGHVVASFCIEGIGLSKLSDKKNVELRYLDYLKKYL